MKNRIATWLAALVHWLDETRNIYVIDTVRTTAREKAENEAAAAARIESLEIALRIAERERKQARHHLFTLAQITKRRIHEIKRIAASIEYISAGRKMEILAGDIEQDAVIYTSMSHEDAQLPVEKIV